jgi:hypothetical protein
MRRVMLLPLATLLALSVAIAPAGAATLTVTSTADDGPGSLGYTIEEAGHGDTIRIPPGEYLLTSGDTLIDQQNVLRGAGARRTTVEPSGGGDALDQITYSGITIAPAKQAGDDGGSSIETKARIIALIGAFAFFVLILELVRRRRLVERYALLWMFGALVLFLLAIFPGALDAIADAIGIQEPANAIFILALGVIFLLLLNFSVATSRLSEETKILAQEAARAEQELRVARGELAGDSDNGASAAGAERGEHERPVGAQDDG